MNLGMHLGRSNPYPLGMGSGHTQEMSWVFVKVCLNYHCKCSYSKFFVCLLGVISLCTQVTTTFIYVRVAHRYEDTMYGEEFDFYELEWKA
jgi:hypothetical protein